MMMGLAGEAVLAVKAGKAEHTHWAHWHWALRVGTAGLCLGTHHVVQETMCARAIVEPHRLDRPGFNVLATVAAAPDCPSSPPIQLQDTCEPTFAVGRRIRKPRCRHLLTDCTNNFHLHFPPSTISTTPPPNPILAVDHHISGQ